MCQDIAMQDWHLDGLLSPFCGTWAHTFRRATRKLLDIQGDPEATISLAPLRTVVVSLWPRVGNWFRYRHSSSIVVIFRFENGKMRGVESLSLSLFFTRDENDLWREKEKIVRRSTIATIVKNFPIHFNRIEIRMVK